MPTICKLDSIKIDLYGREHLPPHFHALYAEHEALVEIQTLFVLRGSLPGNQHRRVMQWAQDEKVRVMLLENFYALNPRLKK
jgi:hypothetical protein